jgi:hypothetical protein
MGVRFSLEHANYVSYLISHDPVVVPRANRRHLSDFLLGLTGFYHTSDVGFTAFDDRAVRIGIFRSRVDAADRRRAPAGRAFRGPTFCRVKS